MKKFKIGLLTKVVIAIVAGIICGFVLPEWPQRLFATFNALFSNFLGFFVPLLILGLIVPGIANVGKNAGRLLGITLAIAYLFTICSGIYSWGCCEAIYPTLLNNVTIEKVEGASSAIAPFFTIEIPPIMGVMSALTAAFIIGIGITIVGGETIKKVFDDFQEIITLTIKPRTAYSTPRTARCSSPTPLQNPTAPSQSPAE